MAVLDQLTHKNYLSIETFRKNGIGVKTPVWFVQEGDTLYISTGANSGKVKRIRKNERVNIAPCKMNGAPDGDWVPAIARIVADDDTATKVDHLLDKKYGLIKKLFGMINGRRGAKPTFLELKASIN